MENQEALEKTPAGAARERIAADLKTLFRDVEDMLKVTAEEMGEKAKQARERLQAALERAKVSCAHLPEQTAVAAKKADVVIRNHPYESLGVAFGLGLLIGLLSMRK